MDSQRIWIYSFMFLTLIILFLHLLHILVISQSFTLNHQPVRLKKQPLLPLRFNYDGTFKILQVIPLAQTKKKTKKERTFFFFLFKLFQFPWSVGK